VLGKISGFMDGNRPNRVEFRITSKLPDQRLRLTLRPRGDGQGKKLQLRAPAANATSRFEYEQHPRRHNANRNCILSIPSHDLRCALSNIALVSGMLKEQHLNETFKDGNNFTEIIERTCTQALDLINQYVDRELLESTDIEVKKTRVEIVGRVNSIIETLE